MPNWILLWSLLIHIFFCHASLQLLMKLPFFQWIDKELQRLEKEIERAHEKGWRQEYPFHINWWSCSNKLIMLVIYRGCLIFLFYYCQPISWNSGKKVLQFLDWSCFTMLDLLYQKKVLSTPAERQRRLEEVPEVAPDTEEERKETESEAAASKPIQGNRGKHLKFWF